MLLLFLTDSLSHSGARGSSARGSGARGSGARGSGASGSSARGSGARGISNGKLSYSSSLTVTSCYHTYAFIVPLIFT